jgi:hypothetical protein
LLLDDEEVVDSGDGDRGSGAELSTPLWLTAGHSRWTQWNTSLAVLCVPTILKSRFDDLFRPEFVFHYFFPRKITFRGFSWAVSKEFFSES